MEGQTFEKLMEPVRRAVDFGCIVSRLDWDERTFTPERGREALGVCKARIASEAHIELTDPAVEAALLECGKVAAAGDGFWPRYAGRLLTIVRRRKALSAEFVAEKAAATSAGYAAWVAARKASDFSMFSPHLRTIIEFARQEAIAYGADRNDPASLYTALLEDYEPGMTAQRLLQIVGEVRDWLVPFVRRVRESKVQLTDDILRGYFPVDRQEMLCTAAIRLMGYKASDGVLVETPHPFTSMVGPFDVRVTTHYKPDFLGAALFGSMHEAGHALYELGKDERLFMYWPPSVAQSLGLHESQSRLWENLVGRSRAFWQWFHPMLATVFPEFWEVTPDAIYEAVNAVRPSPIRIYADELMYNLHIALRVGLELELLSGNLAVADLPAAWNAKMAEYVGYTPANDAEGCLQDVHWSTGNFGYFGTYLLGNLASAQIFNTYQAKSSFQAGFVRGDLVVLREGLREHMYPLCQLMTLDEALTHTTGGPLNPQHWFEYAERKFGALYKL